MTSARIKTTELVLNRVIPASPEAVFDAWMDSTSPGSPFFGVTRAIVNPVVDGLFYTMYLLDGVETAHYGRFVVLERGRQIQQTWVSQMTLGLESLVAIRFEAQ